MPGGASAFNGPMPSLLLLLRGRGHEAGTPCQAEGSPYPFPREGSYVLPCSTQRGTERVAQLRAALMSVGWQQRAKLARVFAEMETASLNVDRTVARWSVTETKRADPGHKCGLEDLRAIA